MSSSIFFRRNKLIAVGVVLFLLFCYTVFIKTPATSCDTKLVVSSTKTTKPYETFIIVVVLTGPRNENRRDALRQTWLSKSSKGLFSQEDANLSHLFVLGVDGLESNVIASLKKEQSQHHDMLLLEDFADAYEKLTEKLERSLTWINDNVNFKYLFKCDDDTYARIDVIRDELKMRYDTLPAEMLYLGYFYGKGKVKKSGPWKETEWRLCDMYIPYARGGGYILSNNIVLFVATNFPQFKTYLSEDVSMGSWLAPLKVNRVHDKRFDTEYKTRGCSNTFLVSHKQSIDDMHAKHVSLKRTGMLCEKEFANFHGYEYDWNVPPSQCCMRKESIP